MDTLTSWLKNRYDAVLQSGSESQFYQNVHQYIDFIVKTPALAKIIDASEQEYAQKHLDINGTTKSTTDKEADEKEEQVHRLERFSLYAADYALLYGRIYLYIEEYKNNTEPDERPYPAAIVMLRGINGITTKLWSKKIINQYGRWYTGKRKEYESRLRQFHGAFIAELEKTSGKMGKPAISFDAQESLLKIGDKTVSMTLKNDKTNAHYVLEYLFENTEGLKTKSYYSDIIEKKFPLENLRPTSMRRACEDINKKVSEQASISNFLIIKSGKTGFTQINPDYL